MTMPYPQLFSPLALAGQTLRNRICLPATVTNLARANRITEPYKNFLIERAKGGAAMLTTEVIAVDPNAVAQPAIVTGFDAANDADFRDLAGRVRAAAAALVGQLWHPGKQQLWGATSSPMGVSDQPDAYSWTVPRVMTDADIAGVIAAFVAVAAKLARLGFAGVELHGAHGYLINQFLSPWSNARTDRWGGAVENRVRFARAIAAGVRDAAGADFIVGLKMPGTEEVSGGIDPDEAERLTAALAEGGGLFDYFAYSQGNFSLSLESHVPDLYYRPGHFLDIPKRMRKAAGAAAVMALGRLGSPEEAEAALADGAGDLIGMTRALIADADLPLKAAADDSAAIRPTTFDNTAWGLVHQGKPLLDHLNPLIGQAGESGWRPPRSDAPKTVAIVGAGPAGLEAAWVAAARGPCRNPVRPKPRRRAGAGGRPPARTGGHGPDRRLAAPDGRPARRRIPPWRRSGARGHPGAAAGCRAACERGTAAPAGKPGRERRPVALRPRLPQGGAFRFARAGRAVRPGPRGRGLRSG